MKTINAKGLACPRPVILTKKAIQEENPDQVLVLVDNEIATENLNKMAEQMGYRAEVKKNSPQDYEVLLKKSASPRAEEGGHEVSSDFLIAISSDQMGRGDEEFSKILLDNFLFALKETDHLPKYLIFYNTGVLAATGNKDILEDLKILDEKGVQILYCGLCADYYGVKDKIQVGQVTNMYHIVELMESYRVVRP